MTKPILLILHGWGHNTTYWKQIKEKLSNEYDVHTWDLPGFGKEPLISPTWTIPDYAGWVAAKVQESFKGKSLILLGHSFGGRIAAYLASRNPSWLKALVLYGAPCLYRPSGKVKTSVAFAKLLKPFFPQNLRRKFMHEEIKDADQSGLGLIYRNTVPFDQTESIKEIAVPTFLLWGERDKEAPLKLAEEMKTLIPNASLTIFPDLGHNAHSENPTLFYGKLRTLLETIA